MVIIEIKIIVNIVIDVEEIKSDRVVEVSIIVIKCLGRNDGKIMFIVWNIDWVINYK